MRLGERLDARHDALVARAAGQLAQALVATFHQLGAGFPGALDEGAHALVAPARIEMHLGHRGGMGLEADGDGVEAEQDGLGRTHACDCRRHLRAAGPTGLARVQRGERGERPATCPPACARSP
jgi:hypothetical protein